MLEEGSPAPGRGLLAVVDGLAARGDVGKLGGLQLDEAELGGLLGLVDESLEHLKFREGLFGRGMCSSESSNLPLNHWEREAGWLAPLHHENVAQTPRQQPFRGVPPFCAIGSLLFPQDVAHKPQTSSRAESRAFAMTARGKTTWRPLRVGGRGISQHLFTNIEI